MTSILFGLFASGVTFYILLRELRYKDYGTALILAFLLGVLVELTAIMVAAYLTTPLVRVVW